MASGGLVDDDVMIDLVKEKMNNAECKNGFILDGFPRTMEQAQKFDDLLKKSRRRLTGVIEFKVNDETLVSRLSGRLIHEKSGRTYNMRTNPPRVPGKDDESGEPLIQRDDDKEETVRNRLKVFSQKTQPVINYYRGSGALYTLDADRPIESVTQSVEDIIARAGSRS